MVSIEDRVINVVLRQKEFVCVTYGVDGVEVDLVPPTIHTTYVKFVDFKAAEMTPKGRYREFQEVDYLLRV